MVSKQKNKRLIKSALLCKTLALCSLRRSPRFSSTAPNKEDTLPNRSGKSPRFPSTTANNKIAMTSSSTSDETSTPNYSRSSSILSSAPAIDGSITPICLSRSPRFVSAATNSTTSTSTRKRASRSDALALSVNVIGCCEPLDVYIPDELSNKCLRRSSRFTTNKFRSSQENVESTELNVVTSKPSRSSPRLSAADAALEFGLKEMLDAAENQKQLEKRNEIEGPLETAKFIEAGEKCLRSRSVPRREVTPGIEAALFDSIDEAASKKVKTSTGKSDLKMSEGTCLRRSPRLGLGSIGASNGNVKSELTALPERSRKKQLSKEIKSTLGNTALNLTEKCLLDTPFEDLDGRSDDCLTSQEAPFLVINAENVETNQNMQPISNNSATTRKKKEKRRCCFIGEPIPEDEAHERWRWRYELKSKRSKKQGWILNADEEDEIILNVECHYNQAVVDDCIFNLGDCAYVKGQGTKKHVGRILEFFKTMEDEAYFRVQWFFRAEDTVMKEAAVSHDKKRLFYSTIMNDNILGCIISKVNVTEMSPLLGSQANYIPSLDFYYDMEYCVEYSTFRNFSLDNYLMSCDLPSPNGIDTLCTTSSTNPLEHEPSYESNKTELILLDLYAGCGAMSTGLCFGAKLSGVNLVTRWAVDCNKSACDSLRLNHPETLVRNERADDFLELLKSWKKLCEQYVFNDLERTVYSGAEATEQTENNANSLCDNKFPAGEYEVSHLVDICYGDPEKSGKRGLKFKVQWMGYGPDEDTWEPIEGLSNCQEHIRDFVRSGLKSKILPLPGGVDFICGGPPCQGISGYNRFRNVDDPLSDERNRQIVVFMDIVDFLMPKYVLMENVVDILRFDKASLGRYALSRLVHMKYQARLGTMAAGCYGLPQFRLRVFLWGALPSENLPQFPLPTHDVVVKYWPPLEFERNTVAYDEGQPCELEDAVILRDAISDLPAVTSFEVREEMTYDMPPETEFQRFIRSTKEEMMVLTSSGVQETKGSVLYDHRPYPLTEEDYIRVCQIPRRKGANFRDLPGVVVGDDNVVRRDPEKEAMLLPSGKPMVPDFAFTYEQGKSKRPYGRLWWDETMPTVLTFPSLHNQAALHPEQDRVLTIRECARLQGFPDFYRFCGTVRARYCQIGNAVAIPVARALGYAFGRASQKHSGDDPLMTLPPKFAFQRQPMDEILTIEN